MGRKSPVTVIANVPDIDRLSDAPAIVTKLLFLFESVFFVHGTNFKRV